MRILGIDPGINTGIVLLSNDSVVYHVTVSKKSPLGTIARLIALGCDAVAIEDVPNFGSTAQVKRFGLITLTFKETVQIFRILPGEWKPFAKAQKWTYPGLSTIHERDAYCIARYVMKFKMKGTQNEG